MRQAPSTTDMPRTTFAAALEQIAAQAGALDREPRFPHESFQALMSAGVPQLVGEHGESDLGWEIASIRALASADASTARILDGHFNGVERLALGAPEELREHELQLVAEGELLVGVWGADPGPGEGSAASIERDERGMPVLRGVKTFCSGAGGVGRALVVACDERGGRRLAYADVTRSLSIDRSWYRASGLRSSESHRVEFHDTPVLAILGEENEITREPWFSRDAVRSAATWAGIADCIVRATLTALGGRACDESRLQSIGRMRVAQSTIDRWLEHAAAQLQDLGAGPAIGAAAADDTPLPNYGSARALAGECRVALADAARLISAEAAQVCGSRALIDGGTLDRARRDLDLFLLQHRLGPKLVELGAQALAEGAP
jgi:alkylation response protein AidB-like acyl-CoA dehydrogenase